MTSTQITKLAAAGLTVEQIAVVAEVMEPQKNLRIFRTANIVTSNLDGDPADTPIEPFNYRPEQKPDPHPHSWGTENR